MLKDSNYLFGVFAQTSKTIEAGKECLQPWTENNYTITADGWYGIAFAHADKTTEFKSDSLEAPSYIELITQ